MGRKRAFTLVEILAAIVIVAVLASIAIPGFSKARDKASANQAIAYLRTIRTAQKMYYGKWRAFVNAANDAAIKSTLGAEAKATGYTFSVTGDATTFTATAQKGGAANTITLKDDGTWNATGTEVRYKPIGSD